MSQSPLTKLQQLHALRKVLAGDQLQVSEGTLTGLAALDVLLPSKGVPPGSLLEWFCEKTGAGSWLPALLMARQFQRRGDTIVVVDPSGEFYPPGVHQLGIDLNRLVVVRAINPQEVDDPFPGTRKRSPQPRPPSSRPLTQW